jgi:hypothetical protein
LGDKSNREGFNTHRRGKGNVKLETKIVMMQPQANKCQQPLEIERYKELILL